MLFPMNKQFVSFSIMLTTLSKIPSTTPLNSPMAVNQPEIFDP